MKLTRMMVYVKLGDGRENVRVWQCNVDVAAPKTEMTGGIIQGSDGNDEATVKRLQEELKSVRDQLDHVTNLLNKLTMDKGSKS